MDTLRTQIGARLRQIRQEAGHTQDAMSQTLGMDRGNLSKCEHGQLGLTLDQLHALARTYHVDLHWLVTGDR